MKPAIDGLLDILKPRDPLLISSFCTFHAYARIKRRLICLKFCVCTFCKGLVSQRGIFRQNNEQWY